MNVATPVQRAAPLLVICAGALSLMVSLPAQTVDRAGGGHPSLAARRETPAASGRRGIPADGVAPSSHTDDMLGRRALSAGRLAALAATLAYHQGLPGDQSPDRIVAERVLRLGGAVVLEGQRRPIVDLQGLPATDFRLHTVDLVGVSMGAWGLKDELSRLPPLPHLKELYINGRLWYNQPPSLVADTLGLFATSTELEKLVLSKPVQTYIPLEDEALEKLGTLAAIEEMRLHQTRLPGHALAPFTRLKYLDLSYNRFFDDRGLRQIAGMTGLTRLYLTGTSISDDGLVSLAGLTNLTELSLHGTGISDAGLAHLAKLTNLHRLNLLGCNVSDSGLASLERMTGLEELTLYRTKVSNAGLDRLRHLTGLRSLDVRYSRVTPPGVKELKAALPDVAVLFDDSSNRSRDRAVDLAAIRGKGEDAIANWLQSVGGRLRRRDGRVAAVALDSTSITDREVAVLQELRSLEELSLRDTEISDLAAAHLMTIGTLRRLDVSHTLLDDAALDKLGALTGLRSLDVAHTLVEGPGLKALAGLNALAEINLGNTPLGDEGLGHVARLTGLKKLTLSYTDVSDDGLAQLASLTGLVYLDVSGADIGDKGLAAIAKMTALEDLRLNFGRFTDAGLQAIASLPALKRLALSHTRFTNAGMAAIGRLATLESLDLNYTPIGNAGIARLSGLTNLADLSLDSVELTDAGVAPLAGLRSLRQLDLYHTLVTDKGFEQLKAALPGCVIHYVRDSAKRERRS